MNNQSQQMHETVNTLARMATAGTFKRIVNATGDGNIRQMRTALQHDYSILDNLDNNVSDTISDAYDCYITAYSYLLDQYNNGLTAEDLITIDLKNGTTKTRTVYQWACVEVRKYIYGNKAITNDKNYIYIEDMAEGTDGTAEDALDREYIRLGLYSGLGSDGQYGTYGTYNDYTTYNDMITALNLTHRQLTIVTMRMQGLSLVSIADKLQVTAQTINKQLDRIRNRVTEIFPDAVKLFNLTKHSR